MALKTAGTAATTSLTAIQWQPALASTTLKTDLATLIASIRTPVTGAYGAAAAIDIGYIENGILQLPDKKSPGGIRLDPGDWIMVDGAGWVIVVPGAIFATSWVHS